MGARIGDGARILEQYIIYNGYKYIASGYIDLETKEPWIQLGCFLRKLSDWEENFWNNDNEFPNNGGFESERRLKTYNTLKLILKTNGL